MSPAPERSRLPEVIVGFGLAAVTVYGIVVWPLRAWLIGLSPVTLAAITGSRVALVAVGAFAAQESGPWVWPLLVAIVSILKFHWVFYWAGRLWGQAALVRVAGQRAGARRRIRHAEALVQRHHLLAIVATYAPVPLPKDVVFVALGTARVPFRRFMVIDIVTAAVSQTLFLALGMWLGESAVAIVRAYAVYAAYVAAGVVLVMIVTWWRRRRARDDTGVGSDGDGDGVTGDSDDVRGGRGRA